MLLERLRIRDLRCIAAADLELRPALNVFIGDNGSGKTSLLESVYLLSRAASFRLTPGRQLIRDGCTQLTVHARRRDAGGASHRLALLRDHDSTQAAIDGDRCASLAELMRLCPALILEPGSHRLLEDGPANRRKLLDWVVFHVEHDFLGHWREYARALRQRNACLRHGRRGELGAWTAALVRQAERIDSLRADCAAELLNSMSVHASRLLGEAVTFSGQYRRGWARDATLDAVLERQLATDSERGFTHAGPHRAELRLQVGGNSAGDVLSRGQRKLLLLAAMLAQADLLRDRAGLRPILLVDDWAAELGASARTLLLDQLVASGCQVLLTALDRDQALADAGLMFHVKHGTIGPVL